MGDKAGFFKIVPQTPQMELPKKVAAYARVSTGKDAMLHSLSSQVSYYSTLVNNTLSLAKLLGQHLNLYTTITV